MAAKSATKTTHLYSLKREGGLWFLGFCIVFQTSTKWTGPSSSSPHSKTWTLGSSPRATKFSAAGICGPQREEFNDQRARVFRPGNWLFRWSPVASGDNFWTLAKFFLISLLRVAFWCEWMRESWGLRWFFAGRLRSFLLVWVELCKGLG